MTVHRVFEAETVSDITFLLSLNADTVSALPSTGVLWLCSCACPRSRLRSHVFPTRAGPTVITFTIHSRIVAWSVTAFLNSVQHSSCVKPVQSICKLKYLLNSMILYTPTSYTVPYFCLCRDMMMVLLYIVIFAVYTMKN